MSKVKTTQIMVTKNQKYLRVPAQNNNKVFDLHPLIEKSFKDVKFHNDFIFSHKVNGKEITTLLLRLVGSGVTSNPYAKRAQIRANMIDRIVDDTIVVYSFLDSTVFIKCDINLNKREFPKSITNLFWIKLQEIAKCFESSEPILIKKDSSISGVYNLVLSEKPLDLYNNNIKDLSNTKLIDDDEIRLEDFDDNKSYDDAIEVIDEDERMKIGRAGEIIVNKLLKDPLFAPSGLDNFKWMNEKTESGKPYDFKGNKFFLEVKSSKNINDGFLLSSEEMKILNENREFYILVKLNGVNWMDNTFKNITIINGSELQENMFDKIIKLTYSYKGGANE